MRERVTCPNCGESNPADLLYCLACQWQLRPLDDDAPPSGSSEPESGWEAAGEPAVDGDLPADWSKSLRDASASGGADGGAVADVEPDSSAGEDFLAGLARQDQPEDEEVPAWIATIMGLGGDREDPGPRAAADTEVGVGEVPEEFPTGSIPASADDNQPDLLSPAVDREDSGRFRRMESEPSQQEMVTEEPEDSSEIHNWVKTLDASAEQKASAAVDSEPKPATTDVPRWVSRLGGVQGYPYQPDSKPPQDTLPAWLIDTSAAQERHPTQAEETGATPDLPEWAAKPASGNQESESRNKDEPPEPAVPSATPVAPAFSPESLEELDVDAVFASMQLPDWLDDMQAAGVEESPRPLPADQESQGLPPAELPAWIQAMRPVESASSKPAQVEPDAEKEEHGPLLGLLGVIPVVPGAAVSSSRTAPQSISFNATDQQRAHAALLERLLADETAPVPLRTSNPLRPERTLRWAIGALLIAALGTVLLLGTHGFPLPAGVPNESVRAIEAVQSIPPDARVLLAFEFEPATVGEMEASAASILDHLLLLKHPRLAVISTSPTGSVLAERFISTTLNARGYQRGIQYVSLGYLAGGLAGVQAFARDPVATVPLGAGSEAVWGSGVLDGATHLSDFAAIIVLTDSLEGGRVWIEQTASARGSSSLVVVSSAQAGPMLLPYADSGQVDGLVSGLNGAAGVEMANGGLPGYVRQYWDAYSMGLLLAAVLICAGAAWHIWRSQEERRMERVG